MLWLVKQLLFEFVCWLGTSYFGVAFLFLSDDAVDDDCYELGKYCCYHSAPKCRYCKCHQSSPLSLRILRHSSLICLTNDDSISYMRLQDDHDKPWLNNLACICPYVIPLSFANFAHSVNVISFICLAFPYTTRNSCQDIHRMPSFLCLML